MTTITTKKTGRYRLWVIENKWGRLAVFPQAGGKITSIYHKGLNQEFLWRNEGLELEVYPPGTEYDPVFYGGVDELLPNDIPENVDGIAYPDHGELWTTPLLVFTERQVLLLEGNLPLSGLYYRKCIRLDASDPVIYTDYLIRNDSDMPRHFLWKLHAALRVGPHDNIRCSARYAQIVDPGYSRFSSREPFYWPVIEGTDVSRLPQNDGSIDFFYLYQLEKGEVSWESADRLRRFDYDFDRKIFPYVWIFASYGGFLGHHTVVLEPCTAMPISVREAAALDQCTVLAPGESLATTVRIYAGPY